MNDELREQLADVQHEIWAHWMRYQFSQCRRPAIADDGSLIIPTDKVERWTRQMNTPYSDLTDKEQGSDRHQADKVLAVVRADIAAANARVQELESALAVAGQRGWHKEALDTLAVNMQQGQEIDQLRADLAAATGLTEKQVLEFVNRADLYRINGIGSEYADLLEAAGVDTVAELAQRNADNLAEALKKVNDEKQKVRNVPGAGEVAKWIEQAKSLPRAVEY